MTFAKSFNPAFTSATAGAMLDELSTSQMMSTGNGVGSATCVIAAHAASGSMLDESGPASPNTEASGCADGPYVARARARDGLEIVERARRDRRPHRSVPVAECSACAGDPYVRCARAP